MHANPRGATAKRLVGQFLPLLRSCHAAVPFSTSERYAVMGKMNSLLLFFGMATLFYTVAHNDIDNQLVLYLSIGGSSAQVPLPGVSQRFASLAKNLVAAARIFERQVRAFLEVLLGLPSASVTRKDRPVCARRKGLLVLVLRVALATSVKVVEVCIFTGCFGVENHLGSWIWCGGTVI